MIFWSSTIHLDKNDACNPFAPSKLDTAKPAIANSEL